MAEWEGFTEDDLKKLQSGNNNARNSTAKPRILKPVSKKRVPASSAATPKAKLPAKKKGQNPVSEKSESLTESIPNAAKLSRPTPHPARSKSMGDTLPPKEDDKTPSKDKSDCIFDDETIKKKEKLKLEDVQLRQKQMEERNRKKKAMLTKEIAERKKKATAESSKLLKVQQELSKLDQLLNFDVSILRDKIDEACMEFSSAQKRFNKAEAEYIAAKMDLHSKTTLKEDLTEHLFNLIQANEERKAKKLEELMLKLDVEEDELEAKENKRNEEVNSTVDSNSKKTASEGDTTPGKDNSKTETTNEVAPQPSNVNNDNLHGGNPIKADL